MPLPGPDEQVRESHLKVAMTMSMNPLDRVIEVPFIVENVDLENPQHLFVISENFSHLGWSEEAGQTVATAFVDGGSPVADALQIARQIRNRLPGSTIDRLRHELVAVTEIAERVGVSREAVRQWSRNVSLGFPVPEATVATGTKDPMKVWRWSEIVDWLRSAKRIEMDEYYLTRVQAVELEACLNRVHDRNPGWIQATPASYSVSHEVGNVVSIDTVRSGGRFRGVGVTRSSNVVFNLRFDDQSARAHA